MDPIRYDDEIYDDDVPTVNQRETEFNKNLNKVENTFKMNRENFEKVNNKQKNENPMMIILSFHMGQKLKNHKQFQ